LDWIIWFYDILKGGTWKGRMDGNVMIPKVDFGKIGIKKTLR
jgi:hypothetical protein